MTSEQEARVTELTRLLNSEKHAHNPNRPLWESERYSIVANSVGQQGNYVSYASARDAQKAAGLQEAISEIDEELASLDGKDGSESRVGILRGDRQRYTDQLAALQGSGVQTGRIAGEEVGVGAQQVNAVAPEGFDFTVPEKYNARPGGSEAETISDTMFDLPAISQTLSSSDTTEPIIIPAAPEPIITDTELAKPDAVPDVIDVETAIQSSDAPADADRNDSPVEETPSQSTDPADDDIPF